jgi:hypothetical protein
LGMHRASGRSKQDAYVEDHSNDLPTHEDLPMNASPMCRLETEVVPVCTPVPTPATASLGNLHASLGAFTRVFRRAKRGHDGAWQPLAVPT